MPDILRPQARPQDLVAEAVPVRPRARPEGLGEVPPSPPVVADAATEEGALPPEGPVLIGLFLSPTGGSALVRLGTGEVAKVAEGDAVAGAVVTAVSEDGLHLRRGADEEVLTLPA